MNASLLTRTAAVRRWLLLGVIVAIPLAINTSGYRPFPVIKFALLIILVTAALGLRIGEYVLGARDLTHLRRLAVPMAAVAVPLTIAWLAGPYRGFSFIGEYARFQGLLSYLLFAIAGALMYETFRTEPWVVAKALAIAGGIAGIYVLAQKAGIDPVDWEKYGSGSTLGNPNFVGGYLAMTLAPGLYLWTTERKNKALWAVASLAMAGGIVVAGSYGGFIAGLAAAAVVLAGRYGRSFLQKGLGGMVAVALTLASAGMVVSTMIDLGVPVPDRQALAIRGDWWEAAANMGLDHPLIGRGPNAFALEGVQHRSLSDSLQRTSRFPDDPHSVVLSYFSGAGLLGLAGFALLAAWIIFGGLEVYRGRGDPVGLAFLGALAAYLVQSVGSIDELPLRSGLWAALAGIACSLDLRPEDRKAKAKGRGRTKRTRGRVEPVPMGRAIVAVIVTAVVAVPGATYGTRILVGDVRMSDGLALAAAEFVDDGRSKLRSARDLTGHYFSSFLYGALLGRLAGEGDATVADELDDAFAYLDRLPHIPGLRAYADGLAALGRYDEALLMIERATRLDPKNAAVAIEHADILVAAGRPEEAIAILEPFAAFGDRLRRFDDDIEQALARAQATT